MRFSFHFQQTRASSSNKVNDSKNYCTHFNPRIFFLKSPLKCNKQLKPKNYKFQMVETKAYKMHLNAVFENIYVQTIIFRPVKHFAPRHEKT